MVGIKLVVIRKSHIIIFARNKITNNPKITTTPMINGKKSVWSCRPTTLKNPKKHTMPFLKILQTKSFSLMMQ
jgi:hypothetical protein